MLPNRRLKNNITAILNSMETIVISTVKTFREDFFEDVKILKRAKVNEQYIWLVKTTGTWLLNLQTIPDRYKQNRTDTCHERTSHQNRQGCF